jgi:hypothetical protein
MQYCCHHNHAIQFRIQNKLQKADEKILRKGIRNFNRGILKELSKPFCVFTQTKRSKNGVALIWMHRDAFYISFESRPYFLRKDIL